MKRILITLIFIASIFSCNLKKGNSNPVPIDYKVNKYGLMIGHTFNSINTPIDWTWAAEVDIDGKIDSTGMDSYMYLGEPLIRINGTDCLPALFIETKKDLITEFSCSILFWTENYSSSVEEVIKIIKTDIGLLNDSAVIKSLTDNSKYQREIENCIESIEISFDKKTGSGTFIYKIKNKV